MIKGITLAIVIASMGTACHAQREKTESNPTFQSIGENLSDLLAKYPRARSGEANSCAEMKIVSYQKLRDKQLTVRDLTSSQPALEVNEWVYFEGTASGFDRRSELFDLSNAKGILGIAGVDHEAVILIVPNTEIWHRIGKKELLLDDSPSSFASKRGASVCGYGLVVERTGKKYIAIADVIRNGSNDKSDQLGPKPSHIQDASQSNDQVTDAEAAKEEEFSKTVDSSEDTSLQELGMVSPSFTCEEGALPSETAICSNRSLAVLDRELAVAYRNALKQVDRSQDNVKRSYLVSMQRQWLIERNKQCEADAVCLEEYMKSRIAELKTD